MGSAVAIALRLALTLAFEFPRRSLRQKPFRSGCTSRSVTIIPLSERLARGENGHCRNSQFAKCPNDGVAPSRAAESPLIPSSFVLRPSASTTSSRTRYVICGITTTARVSPKSWNACSHFGSKPSRDLKKSTCRKPHVAVDQRVSSKTISLPGSLRTRIGFTYRVTKGNNFSATTALNCTFKRIGESPAEPLFKPLSE